MTNSVKIQIVLEKIGVIIEMTPFIPNFLPKCHFSLRTCWLLNLLIAQFVLQSILIWNYVNLVNIQ